VRPRIPAACELITKTLARPAPRKGFWVAVLPFKYTGGSAHLTALAEGLTEEIATGLSRFSYLRVIARGSTPRMAGKQDVTARPGSRRK
jgi:TolB-like protein